MSNISENLRYLRKKKAITQQQFADYMGIKRSLVGAYEEYRAEPKYDLLKKMADFYNLSMDQLVNDKINDSWKPKRKGDSSSMRVLTVAVNDKDQENIALVPVKASAGYLNGYADPEFIGELPIFNLPILSEGTYRAFELSGDSMLPLDTGTIIVAEYEEDWENMKPGSTYVVVSKFEGIVYKRLVYKFRLEKGIKLASDNKVYEPYWIETNDILEVWKPKAYISKNFPEFASEPTIASMDLKLVEMQRTISSLKDKFQ